MTDKSSSGVKPTRVIIPKVWKRPHSTIYGKNVEFGSKLTSDKLGEINGRKFNSELPWQVRNSGSSSTTSIGGSSQGYLSKLLNEPQTTLVGSVVHAQPGAAPTARLSWSAGGGGGGDSEGAETTALDDYQRLRAHELAAARCANYADVLEVTNPYRYSKRRREREAERERLASQRARASGQVPRAKRIDFFDNYLNYSNELTRMSESSRLMSEPLLHRRTFDKNLDFNYELGLFLTSPLEWNPDDERNAVPKRTLQQHHLALPTGAGSSSRALTPAKSPATSSSHWPPGQHTHGQCHHSSHDKQHVMDINQENCYNQYHFHPVVCATQRTHLLPRHSCQLSSSPYGQSADGRKLSLGSINPHSYRPSLPNKSSTLHATDGEEFEFQDKSSPFYTDRWAGKTIRHFDSDLYSNANLFKSMIL